MIKQHPTQTLEHGKALCGGVFSRFVEAWNWLIGSFAEMRGDADLDPQNGHITRDDSGAFPVLRLTNLDTLGTGGGGGGGGGNITIAGTSGSHTGNAFHFVCGSDSALTFAVDASGNITVNVYYK